MNPTKEAELEKLRIHFEDDRPQPGYGNILYTANDVKVKDMAFIKAVHPTLKAVYFWVDTRDTLEAAGEAFHRARYKTRPNAEVDIAQYEPMFTFEGKLVFWHQTMKEVKASKIHRCHSMN